MSPLRFVVLLTISTIVAFMVFGAFDTFTAQYSASKQTNCVVVGLAQGNLTSDERYSSVWLACPEADREKSIEIRVDDPRKFAVGSHARCGFSKATGSITGWHKARYTKISNCEPA